MDVDIDQDVVRKIQEITGIQEKDAKALLRGVEGDLDRAIEQL